MNDLEKEDKYVNKIILFERENGCIPANAVCFCYRKEGVYYWVHFKEPILGMQNIKIHEEVIKNHGSIK